MQPPLDETFQDPREIAPETHADNVFGPQRSPIRLHQLCRFCRLVAKHEIFESVADAGIPMPGDTLSLTTISHGTLAQLIQSCAEGCHLCSLLCFLLNSREKRQNPYVATAVVQLAISATRTGATVKLETAGQSYSGITVKPYPSITCKPWHSQEQLGSLSPYLGRQVNVPTTSLSFDLLQWIKHQYESCKGHQSCQNITNLHPNGQPSRILDLSHNRVRVCNVESITGKLQYMTLSHIWGTSPNKILQLRQETLESFREEIPTQLLSPVFLDAIRISRAMGLRYLWIDSLCIVQDSREDWEKESKKMAAVYGKSLCNICYTTTLQDRIRSASREPRNLVACQLQEPAGLQRGLLTQLSDDLIESKSYWSAKRWRLPLLKRAWVFQEYLLCPRVVFYGHRELVWECMESTIFEFPSLEEDISGGALFLTDLKRDFYDLGPERQDLDGSSTSPAIDIGKFSRLWGKLIKRYIFTSLTFEKDRVPALAGLAQSLQHRTGYTYLAGNWIETFVPFLLWFIDTPLDDKQMTGVMAQKQLGVPSWSWFSFASSQNNGNLNLYNIEQSSDYCCKEYSRMGSVVMAQFVTYEYSSPDDIHQSLPKLCPNGLRVQIQTLLLPASIRRMSSLFQIKLGTHDWEDWGSIPSTIGPIHRGSIESWGSTMLSPPSKLYAHDLPIPEGGIIHVRLAVLIHTGDFVSETFTAGISVVAAGQGEWSRVGFFCMRREGHHQIEEPCMSSSDYLYRTLSLSSFSTLSERIWLR